MKHIHKHLAAAVATHAAFAAFLPLAAEMSPLGEMWERTKDQIHFAAPAELYRSQSTAELEELYSPIVVHQAERLLKRLEARGLPTPSLAETVKGLVQRQQLLDNELTVSFAPQDDVEAMLPDVTMSIVERPEWVQPMVTRNRLAYFVDAGQIQDAIEEEGVLGFSGASDASVHTIEDDGTGILRADIVGTARNGYDADPNDTAEHIAQALVKNVQAITVPVTYREGTFTVQKDGQKQQYTLLSSGHSNFAGSPDNRAHNVKKAITEQVQGVVVPKGENFAFNSILGGYVTLDKGWVEALGLFGGGAAPTVGGGICQSSTTVYRAAALAGFPILEQRNHSLFVSYYEAHGVGLDATIFPGFHDLRFTNDTPAELILQGRIEGDEVYVDVYGIPDGRTVELAGPYFNTNAPSDLRYRGSRLGPNQIAWVQTVTYADGTQDETVLLSYYPKGFSRVVKERNPVESIVVQQPMHETVVASR